MTSLKLCFFLKEQVNTYGLCGIVFRKDIRGGVSKKGQMEKIIKILSQCIIPRKPTSFANAV